MPIDKSYLFGAGNPSSAKTENQLKFKLLTLADEELRKLFQARPYRQLGRALHREGLRPGLPDKLTIAVVKEDVRIDSEGEWRKRLPGRISRDQLQALKPTLYWAYEQDGKPAGEPFPIESHSFTRFAFTASSKSDKNFHVLLVEHYQPNVEKKLVGNLLFVITPEIELFK